LTLSALVFRLTAQGRIICRNRQVAQHMCFGCDQTMGKWGKQGKQRKQRKLETLATLNFMNCPVIILLQYSFSTFN